MRTDGATPMELSLFQAIELTPITLSMFRIFIHSWNIHVWDILSMVKKYYSCLVYIFHVWAILIHVWDILSLFGIYYSCLRYIIHA